MVPPKKPKKKKKKNKGNQNLALEEVSDTPLEPETQKVSAVLAQSSVRLHVASLASNAIPARLPDILNIRRLYNPEYYPEPVVIKPKTGKISGFIILPATVGRDLVGKTISHNGKKYKTSLSTTRSFDYDVREYTAHVVIGLPWGMTEYQMTEAVDNAYDPVRPRALTMRSSSRGKICSIHIPNGTLPRNVKIDNTTYKTIYTKVHSEGHQQCLSRPTAQQRMPEPSPEIDIAGPA